MLRKLEQSQTYAQDGTVGSISYPTCMTGSCGSAAWDSVDLTHEYGRLTAVGGFAESIEYTPAGAVAKVDHTGPVTDTYTPDETAVRPKSIEFSGYVTCTAPSIPSTIPVDQTIESGQSATLIASGSNATGWQWYEGDGTRIDNATGLSYSTPPLTAETTYYVEAWNDCATVKSRNATVHIGSCPEVTIANGSPADQSIAWNQTATLTVSATGATSYQWYEGNGTPIAGATSASYTTPTLTSDRTYSVEASNECRSVMSRTATIDVGCPTLSVAEGSPTDRTVVSGQSATLEVIASGATSYQWYTGGGTPIAGATDSFYTTPPLTAVSSYYVIVSNDCESQQSRTATVSVTTIATPSGLVATANGTTSIAVSWLAASGADHYLLFRRNGIGGFQAVAQVTGTSFSDTLVSANKTYLYYVRAASENNTYVSPPSNTDPATTMVFTPLMAGQTVATAAHAEQLLAAVNAMRGAKGTAPTTWAAILPQNVAQPAVSGMILGQHILSLRTALNGARQAVGLAPIAFSDSALMGVPIRLQHQTEIRGGVQ